MELPSQAESTGGEKEDVNGTEYIPCSDSNDGSSSDKAQDFLSLLENNAEGSGFYKESDVSECSRESDKDGSRLKRELSLMEDGNSLEDRSAVAEAAEAMLHLADRVNFIDYSGLKKKRRTMPRRRKKPLPKLLWEVWEEEHESWLDDNMMNTMDLENQNEVSNKTAGTPSDLTMPLLRYQNEWLAWALEKEESSMKGGILADEMGMGKTIQAIALVLAKRDAGQDIIEQNGPVLLPSSPSELPEIKCTLVICPLVAACQWANEIHHYTVTGSAKVLVYRGPDRGKSLQQFSDYDFVITTYSTVESEYRRNMMPPKQRCPYCRKSFQVNRLPVHLKYFCGPDAMKTEKQSKQNRRTAKHVLKMAEHESESAKDEARKDVKEKASPNKNMNGHGEISSIDNNKDISADFEPVIPQKKSVFHSVKWHRIILDEAHFIKDRRSNTAKAILSLESSYKWALSGTPLQNRVGELYSLVRFLRIIPYSYYFCRDCDCRILDYCSKDACSSCPHTAMRHFCWWNKYVATPIQSYGNCYGGQRAMHLLRHKILKNIVLRRTKKGRAADLALPPMIVSLRRDVLDIKEDDYYSSLYNDCRAQFNTYVESGTLTNNYACVFDLLTRLRQAVNHPYLVVYSATALLRNESTASTNDNTNLCGICNDQVKDHVVTACGHVFCRACLIPLSADLEQVLCSTCSKPITVDLATKKIAGGQNSKNKIDGFKSSSIVNRIHLDNFQTSTKIEALKEEIRFMVERDGSAKGIVFSQFTSFLDLIKYSLQKCGVKCVQLVGSMSMAAREASLAVFSEDPHCKIFLMSLKAGGVALNLTTASHVFLMDPWWNPAVERQAQDRIHRIGQYRPMRVVRFIIENTIEERILKLQGKKELVFEGTLGGSSEALAKLSVADLNFLFMT